MVSVILTSYNHAKYICESIDSVLNQTFANFELIILDDCSTDCSWQLISQYTDPRVRAFRSGKPGDVAYSFNNAITELARGEYIAIHHSDDVWLLDKLERQVAYLDSHSEIGAVFSNALAISENGTELINASHFYYDIFNQKNRGRHEWLRYFFTHGNALCHPSIMIRKVCYEECGLPRYGMTQLSDLDMWVRLCLKYEIHILPEKLVRFRVRDGEANMSANRADYRIRAFYEYYKLLPNYRKISNIDELVMVFPAAKKYVLKGESDHEFALAMVSLEEGQFSFTKLFALDLLFEIISDPHRAANLKSLYGFDHMDFYVLTSLHDVFAREIIADHEKTIADHEKTIADHEKIIVDHERYINYIHSSPSWRLTRPLRFSANQLRKLMRMLYSMLRQIYMRIGLLRTFRHRYLHGKLRAAEKLAGLVNSSDNLPSLQALSARRFDQWAVLKAMGVPEPAVWPEIDVSVVTFNSKSWVDQFIASILIQHYPLHKIHLRFVDHGSQDDTVMMLENSLALYGARFASVHIIRQSNLGFGAGHDRAIHEGQSAYCLVTNIDLEFELYSLCDVVRVALADTDSTVASWELRQTPYEHPKHYDPVTLETNWSSHACILLRRSAYEKAGGYDPNIFMYTEDVELSYRFRSHGYVLKYVPSAVVRHYTYESTTQVKPMQFCGSAIGNLIVRMRYGKSLDRFSGICLFAAHFFRPLPFPGARKLLLSNFFRFLPQYLHFRRGRGNTTAFFPLRAYDYEMTREGAFWEAPQASVDAAPLVTVMTRTYKGRAKFLQQAVQSVFNQTYPAIELIVVEDGGDSQQELISSLAARAPASCKVRFLANAKLGRSEAGNAALAASEGQYLMFLDDDDLLYSDHIETLVGVLIREVDLSAAYALATEVHTRVDSLGSGYVETSFDTPSIFRQAWCFNTLLDHNFIPIQAILFRRELYVQRGGFDSTLEQLEDWNLWLRYGYGNQFAYVPKTTSLFRSPADYATRSARFGMLHNAYYEAKNRAIIAVKQFGLPQ